MQESQNPRNSASGRAPDEYQAVSMSMKDYMQQVAPLQQEKRSRRKGWIIALILIIILAAAAAAYWFVAMRPSGDATPAVTTTEQQSVATEPEVVEVETTDYSSVNLGLSLEYPEDWDVSEATDTGILTIASPAGKLTDPNGQQVDAQVVVSIRPKPAELTEFDAGNAVAVIESEKIAYVRPSSSQRGETYLSFLSFAGSVNGALDGVYITGDTGYQLGQAIPKADLVPVEPIINISFMNCPDGECPVIDGAALSIDADTWKTDSMLQQAKDILLSLSIR